MQTPTEALPRSALVSRDGRLLEDWHDILCGRPFVGLHNIELDFLTFHQALESVSLNSRKMYENIFSPIVSSQKSKALTVVKPLHRARYSLVTYSSQ